MITANNLTQLIGLLMQIGGVVFVILKGWQWWLQNDLEKQKIKSKEITDVSAHSVELAKHNALTATQVADILKNYQDVIDELEEIKKTDTKKTQELHTLIDKLEDMVKEMVSKFTDFLINKSK